jgi:hypothetical protein
MVFLQLGDSRDSKKNKVSILSHGHSWRLEWFGGVPPWQNWNLRRPASGPCFRTCSESSRSIEGTNLRGWIPSGYGALRPYGYRLALATGTAPPVLQWPILRKYIVYGLSLRNRRHSKLLSQNLIVCHHASNSQIRQLNIIHLYSCIDKFAN